MSLALNPTVPRDGVITITDGASLSSTVVYEDGDFVASGFREGQMATQVFKDRGIVYAFRKIEDQPFEGKFSCHVIGFKGDGATAVLLDIVRRADTWASYTSTLPSTAGDVRTVQIAFLAERSNLGATADSGTTFKYCEITDASFEEGTPGKLSISFTAHPFSNDYITVV